MGPAPRDTHGSSIILGGVEKRDRKTGRSPSRSWPVWGLLRERQGTPALSGCRDWTGATLSRSTSAQRPARWAVQEACSRWREESSGSKRYSMMAALLAQEELTVFCIYMLIFHLFLKKECSHGHLVSLSGTHACSRASPLALCPWRGRCSDGAGQL